MSFTFTLKGRTNQLLSNFYPPIELNKNKQYGLALIGFSVYNSIPNVEKNNNKFYYQIDGKESVVEIPVGAYDISDLERVLQNALKNNVISTSADQILSLRSNNNTLQCEIKSMYDIDFNKPNSIAEILGFSPGLYKANTLYSSDKPVNIVKVLTIRIEANIISGSFYGGDNII